MKLIKTHRFNRHDKEKVSIQSIIVNSNIRTNENSENSLNFHSRFFLFYFHQSYRFRQPFLFTFLGILVFCPEQEEWKKSIQPRWESSWESGRSFACWLRSERESFYRIFIRDFLCFFCFPWIPGNLLFPHSKQLCGCFFLLLFDAT